MAKCVKCGKPATFDAPENFCDKHWSDWWGDIGRTKKEKRQISKETLASVRKKYYKK